MAKQVSWWLKLPGFIRRKGQRILSQAGIVANGPPICENIVLWAQDRGWRTKRIHDPFILDFPIGENISSSPKLNSLFQAVNGHGYPSQHLIEIPNATIKGGDGFVVLAEGAYLAEGHWRVANVIGAPIYRKEWPIQSQRRLAGDWYCAMGHWGANYHHWLWDEMPRLFSALPHLPSGIKFLVPEQLTDVQRDSLIGLGITQDRLLGQSCFEESTVERLWFATPLGHSEFAATAPDVVIAMKNQYLKAFGVGPNSMNERIFISRANARYRRLLNESELYPVLAEHGIRAMLPEKLTFPEQVRLFSNASVIIGQHGAGLTNMLFARRGSKVLELHGPKVTRYHYWMMANILGHSYDCLVGREKSETCKNITEPDFFVDVTACAARIANVLAQP